MPDISISINNVSFAYNQNLILKDVNFFLQGKDIVTVVGPNGGGKTTLLKLILGLLKPLTGTILINNKPVHHGRECIGYVPQNTNFDQMFPITVFETVLLGRIHPFGFYSKQDRQKALNALEKVGLADVRKKSYFQLSGGMKQRILIARALVSDPDILLLDEPTANVDPAMEEHLNKLLQELNKKMTIVMVTHDLGFVTTITKRVLCVNKNVCEHPVHELSNDLITSAYGQEVKIVRHEHKVRSNTVKKHKETYYTPG